MQSAFPDLVSVKSLGHTYEGRQIRMVSVSLNPSKIQKSNKPAIFMDCGIHAREWISPAFCLYALGKIILNLRYQSQSKMPIIALIFRQIGRR